MESLFKNIYQNRFILKDKEKLTRVWKVLVERFFQKFISVNSNVLELGCGFCFFLNSLKAKEKIGIDANPDVVGYANPDVKIIISNDISLKNMDNNRFDIVFMSNFLEHLNNNTEVVVVLENVFRVLKPGGKVLILQPNFKLVGPAYFDFLDHKVILTDKSLQEALEVTGFAIEYKIKRFLPYTTKSALPKHPLFVKIYLSIPLLWLLFGKQSFFVGRKLKV